VEPQDSVSRNRQEMWNNFVIIRTIISTNEQIQSMDSRSDNHHGNNLSFHFQKNFVIWLYNPIQSSAASMKLSVSLLEESDGWSARCKASICAQTQKDAHTTATLNINVLSGILIHGPDVRTSEDNSCLRLLAYCNQFSFRIIIQNEYRIKYSPPPLHSISASTIFAYMSLLLDEQMTQTILVLQ
jgi:hypothetical protein